MEMPPQKIFESMYEIDLNPLISNLKVTAGKELTFEEVDGTYEIDSDTLRLSFTVDDDLFEVRNIEALKPGLGTEVLSQIHEFADENKMIVIASNVKDTARGFWEKMGYEEGTESGEFIRDK